MHYFTNDEVSSNIQKKLVTINDQNLILFTDNGVFSKKGLDFGTRTLLENLSNIKGSVLDFGCGYGPIGIYIKKEFDTTVDMIDVNLRSLELARKNASVNNVNVNIFESNIYDNVTKKYDYIISNPPIRVGKEILYKILFGAKEHLNKDGELWIVVNKDQGAKTILRDLEKAYNVKVIEKNKGFWVIVAKNSLTTCL